MCGPRGKGADLFDRLTLLYQKTGELDSELVSQEAKILDERFVIRTLRLEKQRLLLDAEAISRSFAKQCRAEMQVSYPEYKFCGLLTFTPLARLLRHSNPFDWLDFLSWAVFDAAITGIYTEESESDAYLVFAFCPSELYKEMETSEEHYGSCWVLDR